MKRIYELIIIVLFAAGCSQSDPNIQVPGEAKTIRLTANQGKRVAQDNEFAFDLLKKTITASGETNVFVSPLSVSIALGMAWNGANGTTKTEIEAALKMRGMSATDINNYYRIMLSTLPSIDPTTKLSIANSLWYKTGFEVKPDFLKVNSDYFNAYIKQLDFSQTWALDTINNWCSKKTNTLIPTILEKIPSNAVMYLMNAVYFKGTWCKRFDKKSTAISKFKNELGNQVDINLMFKKDTFAYAQTDNAQYLEMQYGNKAFSMTIVLPAMNKTTNDILNSLTPNTWTATLNQMSMKEVMVYMPRFKATSNFTLNDELKNMGMKQAFSDVANFSGISNDLLQISEVKHKTYVTVDEDGTEAAAVTSIEIGTLSMSPHMVFMVDRPFLFVIREKSTGVILFIGKMGNVDKY